VKPTDLSGFRDYLPEEASVRQEIVRVFREVCELYGFVPLETPAVERWELLSRDRDDLDVIIYEVRGSRESETGKNPKGLRFDLTVPLSRVVAANMNKLPRLLKRYQVGSVWRGERPQAGRYREFVQCDADIVGTKSILADAELVALMGEVFERLEVGVFKIRINNRKILNGLPALAGFSEAKLPVVLRILDKYEKEGSAAVDRALQKEVASESVTRIMELLAVPPGQEEWLNRLLEIFADIPQAIDGLTELKEISGWLDGFNVSRDRWLFDTTIVRGLAYYTGPVFETFLDSRRDIGSVCSGGRYDDLLARFKQNKPATGISLGLDRLYAALVDTDRLPRVESGPTVVVVTADKAGEGQAAQLVGSLRRAGMRAALYPETGKLRQGLAYASAAGAKFACLVGAEEVSKGTVKIKLLAANRQEEIKAEAAIDFIRCHH
jgi:histidyl-tRNA synthetase